MCLCHYVTLFVADSRDVFISGEYCYFLINQLIKADNPKKPAMNGPGGKSSPKASLNPALPPKNDRIPTINAHPDLVSDNLSAINAGAVRNPNTTTTPKIIRPYVMPMANNKA